VVLGIFSYSGARIVFGSSAVERDLGSSDPVYTAIQLLMLFGGLAVTYRHRQRCLLVLWRAWPFLLMLAVLALSALWSQSPMHTIRRCITVFVLLLYGVSTFAVFGPVRFMRLALRVLLLIALGSLAEAVLRPGIGYDVGDYANAIRGLYFQKNGLGMAMLSAALALSFLVLNRGRFRWSDLAILGGLLVMLALSRSTTSTLLTMLTAGSTVLLVWLDRGGPWRWTSFLILGSSLSVAVLSFAVLGKEGVFDLLDKDPSLTGRTFIWEAAWMVFNQRPLLGHGYSAFWIAATPGVDVIWEHIQWDTPTAHSGYYEVLLQLGLLGAGLVVVLLLATLLRAGFCLFSERRRAAMWIMPFLLTMIILSNSESVLLNPDLNTVYWIIGSLGLAGPVALRTAVAFRVRPGGVIVPPYHRQQL
jgi:O-antigen ligase